MRLAARLMAALFTASLLLPALSVAPVFALAATHFDVSVSPGSGTAGSTFDVTVTALDGNEALDGGYTGTVTFTSTDGGASTVLPTDYTFTTGVSGDNGSHTFTGATTLTAAGNQTITATDTGDGSITGTSTAVDISPAAADKIALSGATTNLASGIGRTFTATIEDQYGNVVDDDTTVVSFDQTGGTGTVTGTGTDTASNGIASKTVTGELVGTVDIKATATGLTDSNVRSFDVVPGTATQIVLTGTTTDLVSGATRLLTATIEDAAGNTETGDDSTSVTFSKTNGTGTVTGLGADTASAGIATLTVSGALVGSVEITASAFTDSNPLTFTVTVGAASKIVLSGSVASLASGGTRQLTATIEDAAGNAETGDNSTVVSFGKTAGAGTVTGLGSDTAAAGVASVTVSAVLAGSISFQATGASLTSNTLIFTIVAGALDHLVLSPDTATVAPNTFQVYTATGADAAGNSLGDVTGATTWSIDGGGTCQQVQDRCRATSAGDHTVTGTDGLATGTATLTISNDAPSCPSPTSNSTNEDTALDSTLPTCTDPNQDTVTYALVADASHGHVTVDLNTGDFTYTPDGDYNGPDSFTFKASDGVNDSNIATYNVTVNSVNDAPSFTTDGDQTILEDAGAQTVNGFAAGSAGPADESGQTLTYVIDSNTDTALFSSQPAISSSGTLTYTPAADANGTATITVHVHDNGSNTLPNRNASPTQTFDITVTAVNDAPSFTTDGDQTVLEDAGAQTVTGFASGSTGPSNESAQTLSYVIDSDSNAALFSSAPAISPSGDLTYTPAANANGTATITVHIVDSGAGGGPNGDVNSSATQTFDINVTAVDDAPTFTIGPDQTVLEDAAAQDVVGFITDGSPAGGADEASQTLMYTVVGDDDPSLFSVAPAISATGELTYTLAANANGTARIDVELSDTGSNVAPNKCTSAAQSFNITVTPVNDAPVAVDDSAYLVKQGTSVTVNAASGVLANDTDVDTAPGLLTAVLDTDVSHGTLTLNANGSFTYVPTGLWLGPDTFTYHANDGTADGNIATVTITSYVNHKPTAVGDIVTVVQGSGYTPINVLANDNAVNPDPGETLLITKVSKPSHGSLKITGGGTGLSYKPALNFSGSDLFTYTISDGVFSASASVLVKVPKDTYRPTVTPPVQSFKSQSIGSSTAKLYLSWTGTDKGYGIGRYELWESINGHAYTKLTLSSATARSASVTVKVGSSYQFKVRAIDKKGNVGAFKAGPKFKVYLYQEGASLLTYTGTWLVENSAAFSGGHAKYTATTNDEVSFTTTGRTFTWIGIRSTARGTADVFVDGVLDTSLNLAYTSTLTRYVVYSRNLVSGTHTIRIVFTDVGPKRIDIDGFLVLR